MLLLDILRGDWPIFMISASNEQLQQQLEYTLIVTAGEFQKFHLNVRPVFDIETVLSLNWIV